MLNESKPVPQWKPPAELLEIVFERPNQVVLQIIETKKTDFRSLLASGDVNLWNSKFIEHVKRSPTTYKEELTAVVKQAIDELDLFGSSSNPQAYVSFISRILSCCQKLIDSSVYEGINSALSKQPTVGTLKENLNLLLKALDEAPVWN